MLRISKELINEILMNGVYRFMLAESHKTTRSALKRSLMIFEFCLLYNIGTCSSDKCISYDFTNPFRGRYCPTEGIMAPNLSWHHCKLFCLYRSSCQAINYNFTSNLCTYLTATCPKAVSDPNMAIVLFTEWQPEQCMEWIPKEDGDPNKDRSVTEGNDRFVARMQKDGNVFVCYLRSKTDKCYSRHGEDPFSSKDGYTCEYLRIRDGCIVYYVDYQLGAPLPRKALIGGHTAEGFPLYIGRKGRKAGYYFPGSARLVAGYDIETKDLKILVSL